MDKERVNSEKQAMRNLHKADQLLQKISGKEDNLLGQFSVELEQATVSRTSKNKLHRLQQGLDAIKEKKQRAKLEFRQAKKILRVVQLEEKNKEKNMRLAARRSRERDKAVKQFISQWNKEYDNKFKPN